MIPQGLSRDLLYTLNPVVWARECLNFHPDPWQASVLRSSSKHLLLNCARQSGKSTIAALVGLHQALFYPRALVLLVSPSLRQSGELFRKVGEMLDRLQEQPRKVEDNRLSLTLENRSRIVSLPGTEGTIRGFSGASLIVEDEAARVADALYYSVRPMLAVSNGRLILMSTPFGKRGHFFEAWEKGGGAWERTRITAEQCPRISPGFLAGERAALGDWWYAQEYECQFTETVDQVFKYDLVVSAVTDSVKPLFGAGRML
jgi:hypothetical protein